VPDEFAQGDVWKKIIGQHLISGYYAFVYSLMTLHQICLPELADIGRHEEDGRHQCLADTNH